MPVRAHRFVWTATSESIQAKLALCRQTLEHIKLGCTAPRSSKKKSQITGYFLDTTLGNSPDDGRVCGEYDPCPS